MLTRGSTLELEFSRLNLGLGRLLLNTDSERIGPKMRRISFRPLSILMYKIMMVEYLPAYTVHSERRHPTHETRTAYLDEDYFSKHIAVVQIPVSIFSGNSETFPFNSVQFNNYKNTTIYTK